MKTILNIFLSELAAELVRRFHLTTSSQENTFILILTEINSSRHGNSRENTRNRTGNSKDPEK